jgi:5,10-methylenetetrahydrofolate reductase
MQTGNKFVDLFCGCVDVETSTRSRVDTANLVQRHRAEGKQICVEIIQQVREIEGVSGVHVMAYRQEELVVEIIEAAGLLPRPRRPNHH